MAGLASFSRSSSIDSSKSGFFQAMRSLSRGSTSSVRPSAASSTTSMAATAAAGTSPDSMSSSPNQQFLSQFPRKVLRKSHKRMSSSHDLHKRRGSTGSDIFSRVSRHSTAMSGSSSSNIIDWRIQPVEMHIAVEYLDPQASKHRQGHLVATPDYILIFKTRADALAALPQIADVPAQGPDSGSAPPKSSSMLPPADPVHVIPLRALISTFRTDNTRTTFGIETWWRLPHPVIASCSVSVFFKDIRSREHFLDVLASLVKARNQDHPDSNSRVYYEVEECVRKIFQAEEPGFANTVPEIFPVISRNALERSKLKSEEKLKKSQIEGISSHFLVVGVNLCFLIHISRASAVQSTALEVKYQALGLVTLESFYADWSSRDERFAMRFREPFKTPVDLELSSRHYRRIILTLTKADKYLKPAWPTQVQTQDIFHVTGLPTPQHIVAGEDFGGFQRTLSAFYAAYRCNPVDWEINWRTQYAPEFRVLPSAKGTTYTDIQLLAVFRALRYNDYFKALSFCDVDLSSLLGKSDSSRKGNVAYLSRTGVCLTEHETSIVQKASLMHQEFHALAFASGKIRQIDLTNCLPAKYKGDPATYSVQFLVPILNLLAAGLTRCNRLFLRGCHLGEVDVQTLAGYMAPASMEQIDGTIAAGQDVVSLEVLDVANCGLTDQSMKLLFQGLVQSAGTLLTLDVSKNFGRVPAALAQEFMESVGSLRQLNLAGSLTGTAEGELISIQVLDRLEYLEEIDLSGFQLNESTVDTFILFLQTLSARQTSMQTEGYGYSLRRLVLNNCGLSGRQAARIFSAMAGLYDVHLHISSNPLESGIDELVQALNSIWGGRFGLHLNMIEFQDEDNYVELINALAANPFIDYLSLVGTAPVPMTDDVCGDKTVAALEHFFEQNQSVRYLDLSGYCGKLDDGQLGKGFGRALRGLANNKTLTHLRIRNQRLHDSTGTLGSAVQVNQTLLYLDCGDNGFNATSLRYMSKSLESNNTLLAYPFTQDELEEMLMRCVKDIPLPPSIAQGPVAKHKKKPSVDIALERQRSLLRDEIESASAEIMGHVSRNMAKLQQDTGCVLDLDEAYDTCGERGWPSLQLRMPEGNTMNGMFTTTPLEEEQAEMLDRVNELGQPSMSESLVQPPMQPLDHGKARQIVVNSDMVMPQITEDMPYRVPQDDDALNSPVDGSSPSWDLSLPMTPNIASAEHSKAQSTMDDSFIEKTALFAEPDLSRILEKFTMEDGTEYVICTES